MSGVVPFPVADARGFEQAGREGALAGVGKDDDELVGAFASDRRQGGECGTCRNAGQGPLFSTEFPSGLDGAPVFDGHGVDVSALFFFEVL